MPEWPCHYQVRIYFDGCRPNRVTRSLLSSLRVDARQPHDDPVCPQHPTPRIRGAMSARSGSIFHRPRASLPASGAEAAEHFPFDICTDINC